MSRTEMRESEFDKFAEEYRALHAENLRWSGCSPEFFALFKVRDIADRLLAQGIDLKGLTILDFGGGIGASIPYFHDYFTEPQVVCMDVSRKNLQMTQARFPGQAQLLLFDGKTIPCANGSFDVVFAACVFHHIEPSEHLGLLRELLRVLKPNGRIFVFEHNPFNPLTLLAVNTCPFDENAQLIRAGTMKSLHRRAGFADVRLRYLIFFPEFLAKLRNLERYLTRVPAGAQYCVEARRD